MTRQNQNTAVLEPPITVTITAHSPVNETIWDAFFREEHNKSSDAFHTLETPALAVGRNA